MNCIQKKLIPCTILLLTVAGCSKESDAPVSTGIHTVNFTTTDLTDPATRVSPDNPVFDDGESFGVSAFTSTNGLLAGIGLPDVLYNAQVEKYTTDDPGYRYMPTVFWPVDGTKTMFAAYYPHNTTVASEAITVSPQYVSGLPEYTVILGKHRARLDFAIAEVGPIHRVFTAIDGANPANNLANDPKDTPIRKTNYVNFRFKRQMAYLSFRAKAINTPANIRMFINAFFIRNTNNKATYGTIDPATGVRGWKDHSLDATTGATLKVSSTNAPISTTHFTDLMDPGSTDTTLETIVMIPQTYSSVELLMYYTLEYLNPEGGCENYVVGSRNTPVSVNWQSGEHYVYDIELAFNDILDESTPFRFNVKTWKSSNVNTDM